MIVYAHLNMEFYAHWKHGVRMLSRVSKENPNLNSHQQQRDLVEVVQNTCGTSESPGELL